MPESASGTFIPMNTSAAPREVVDMARAGSSVTTTCGVARIRERSINSFKCLRTSPRPASF